MNVFQFVAQNHAEVLRLTREHLWMVLASTFLAVLIGIPLGILISRRPGWNKPVLGSANVIQTIPSLALLGFLLPLPFVGGIGPRTALVTLTIYALLPIVLTTVGGRLQRGRPGGAGQQEEGQRGGAAADGRHDEDSPGVDGDRRS